MIGKTNIRVGGGKVTVTLYGGKNEVISYTGKASGSVTLDANGTGTAALKKGSYTFTGGLSGFSRSAEISGEANVYVRPTRIIYWYGIVAQALTLDGNGRYDNPLVVYNATNVTATLTTYDWTSGRFVLGTASAVDITAYSRLKARAAKCSGNSFRTLGYANDTDSERTGTDFTTPELSEVTTSLASVTGSYYLGISGTTSNRQGLREINLYALWLE